MKINPKELVTQTTAGKMRGVSTQAIVSLVKRGRLTAIVIDGHTFVFRKEVERFTPDGAGRPKESVSKPVARESVSLGQVKINPKELVTQTTASKMREVSTQAIVSLVKRGRLTAIVIDGHTFVFCKEVERFTPEAAGRPTQSGKKTRPKKSN